MTAIPHHTTRQILIAEPMLISGIEHEPRTLNCELPDECIIDNLYYMVMNAGELERFQFRAAAIRL